MYDDLQISGAQLRHVFRQIADIMGPHTAQEVRDNLVTAWMDLTRETIKEQSPRRDDEQDFAAPI